MKFPECYELWGSNGRKVLAAEKIRKEWEEPYNPKAQASLQKRLEKIGVSYEEVRPREGLLEAGCCPVGNTCNRKNALKALDEAQTFTTNPARALKVKSSIEARIPCVLEKAVTGVELIGDTLLDVIISLEPGL